MIKVHEILRETIQGEGHNAGMVCDFLRLYGCPVKCHFCDTGYADGGKDIDYQEMAIADAVSLLNSPNVVISGGEPFYCKELPLLISELSESGKKVFIETSGSHWQEISDSVWVTFSPKEHISNYKSDSRFWNRANDIKIVIDSGNELDYYRQKIGDRSCYLQPQWFNAESLGKTLDLLIKNPQHKLSVQMHKYLGIP
jgi:organic radical activating enzyme